LRDFNVSKGCIGKDDFILEGISMTQAGRLGPANRRLVARSWEISSPGLKCGRQTDLISHGCLKTHAASQEET
jgi:hypothetical protein